MHVVVLGLVLVMKYLKSLVELMSVVPRHLLLYYHLDLRNTTNVLIWFINYQIENTSTRKMKLKFN